MSEGRSHAGRPRWYRYAWFIGRAPDLSRRQWRVLGLVSAVSFFEMYDVYLFSLNLKQIQAELAIAEADLGLLGSIVRAGSLLSLVFAMAADRVGRRRMLLFTVLGYTLLTGATALAPDAQTFVVLQFFARAFAVAEAILATVVIVEEFPPEHRGWGIGAAAAIQSCGAGAAALLFGFVEWLPYGWRSLYAFGLLPLLLIAYWRRTLPETDRFAARRPDASGGIALLPSVRLVVALARAYPTRFGALLAASFTLSMATTAATFFTPKYLQDVHGWSPASVALTTFMGGALAILGNPIAGRLADRFGRRPVAAVCALAVGVLAIAFYSASGALLPVLWVALLFVEFGVAVALVAFAAELFPTAQRSTAAGARSFVATAGAIAGLAVVSALFEVFGNNWDGIKLLAGLCVVVPVIVLTFFPETARRVLEDIAPEEPDARN
jgi:MFS family permease